MKIIEAMKKVKENKEKIADLQRRIGTYCANLSTENPMYGDQTSKRIQEWTQSCQDLAQDNIKLLTSIQRTNMATEVAIEIGGKSVVKTIAEWIWRRREYANTDYTTWQALSDRGLRESRIPSSTGGEPTEVKIIRHFDPHRRDEKLEEYRAEPHRIDAALEVINAVTDLIEK